MRDVWTSGGDCRAVVELNYEDENEDDPPEDDVQIDLADPRDFRRLLLVRILWRVGTTLNWP